MMSNNKNYSISYFLLSLAYLILACGCLRQQYQPEDDKKEAYVYKPLEKQLLETEEHLSEAEKFSQLSPEEKSKHTIERKIAEATKKIIVEEKKKEEERILAEKKDDIEKVPKEELDFEVLNLTGKKIYLACFTYIKKMAFTRWYWDKSQVHELDEGQSVIIDIDSIEDEKDRENVYGYLAVFDNKEEAEDSIYELLDDDYKIDIDKIIKLKDKRVVLGIEKYGFKEELLDFAIIDKERERIPELDFFVENQTGRNLFVTCFVYQKKENHPIWRYDKTPVKKIAPGQMAIMDVDTIAQKYDRVYLRGFLGVFDETEEKLAQESTYELLAPNNKIDLGRIMLFRDKKVILEPERYGLLGDIIKFSAKPTKKIDFTKVVKSKRMRNEKA